MMKTQMTSITREQLRIFPYQFAQLLELSIEQKINQHGTLIIKGIVECGLKDTYIGETAFGTNIVVFCEEPNGQRNQDMGISVAKNISMDEKGSKILFDGIVKDISVKREGDLYILEVYAVTHTYLLDIETKRRSFQDNGMTYGALVSQINADYDDASAIVTVEDRALGDFIIQYDETDWEFIVRMASHFKQGVYPARNMSGVKYYFGVPNLRAEHELASHIYRIKKDITQIVRYELDDYQQLALGNRIIFKGSPHYVEALKSQLIGSEMVGTYTLTSEEGVGQQTRKNKLLQGVSVTGHVLAIVRDKVKVHIHQIDAVQEVGKAHWFTYSTIYASKDGSGWYCMPEVSDLVRIQFANTDDYSAYAVSSISQYTPAEGETDLKGDYNIRYIRNPQGMEIVLTPNEVIISANNRSMIILNQNGNITIQGQSSVSIASENNVSITAGNNIQLQASERINLMCGGKAEIDLDSSTGVTSLKGTTVYTN